MDEGDFVGTTGGIAMPSDSEILERIEEEIGWRLPRGTPETGLPALDSSLAGRTRAARLELPEEARDRDRWRPLTTPLDLNPFAYFGAVMDGRGRAIALYLTQLGLETVPAPVWELRHLEVLDCWSNALVAVPPELATAAVLRGVDLSVNRLEVVPQWVVDAGFDLSVAFVLDLEAGDPSERAGAARVLLLNGNPLRDPPWEIIQRGPEAVRAYFASRGAEARPLNEVKVLLVGDGGAGKTSLVRNLLGQPFDEHEGQTHGINIDRWQMRLPLREVRLNLWDFGGQEIMHATHLFFLSQRSLYVLVLDGRKEEDAEYWLKHIESFGGDSPVLVVLNKMDENPAFGVNRRFLQGKYQGIVGFYAVSCKTGAGIKELRAGLREGLGRVRTIETTWPKSWFAIKERLAKQDSHFISHDAYDEMCREAGIEEAAQQETLVQFLHDLGAVVHFGDFGLRHMHVLEPRWLTGAVYAIVNDPGLAGDKGVLDLARLPKILGGKHGPYTYPADTHPYIVDMMRKFELCYPIDDDTVLVPDLLDIQEPEIEFDTEHALRFRLDYDFLPKSIMPRFIVKRHRDIKGDLRWRTGVVLANKTIDATAVIRADEAAKRVYIDVAGVGRREYLTVVRATFLEINEGFEKLPVQERLVMPDAPEVTVAYDHLLRLEKVGQEEYYPEGAAHAYSVCELLGTITVPASATERSLRRVVGAAVTDSDTRETAVAKAKRIVILQPNFFGLGADLYALVDWLRGRGKKGSEKGAGR